MKNIGEIMEKWTRNLALFALVGVLSVSCSKEEEKKKEEKKDVALADRAPDDQLLAQPTEETTPEVKTPERKVKKAYAVIDPTQGFEAVGAVTFAAMPEGGVRIIADIGGLKPGKHGFHIHEHGDCSAPDASSAGGHFNPTNKKHGGPDTAERHVGDLGNIEANASGFAHYDRVDTLISLDGPNSIIGKSVLIHEDEDDLTTDPSGNSGKRIGCGMVVIAE
jgi:Cu-Zn family superoxide dismutase